METIKSIKKRINDIIKIASRDERKMLNNLKGAITSYNDKVYYESNYDKRLCVCNYNKFIDDVSDLNKENFYIIFIKIPNLELSYHTEGTEKEINIAFLNSLKKITSTLPLARKNIYTFCDFLVLVAFKNDANDVYNEVKKIKENKIGYKDIQMTYIKYKKYSAKINKNINACIKQANNIFNGKKSGGDLEK